MGIDTQSSEGRAKWTPERPRLVIDAEKKSSEWAKREPVVDDTVGDDEGGRIMRKAIRDQIAAQEQEKALRTAMEKASVPEPSIDETERAKLDALRARLKELRAAGQAIPRWKRIAEGLGIGSDAARIAGQVAETERMIRSQEDLVRDLAGVPTDAEIDATLASTKEKDPLFNERLRSEFLLIGRMVGSKELFGRLGVPTTNRERDRARETLKRMMAIDGKVLAKWSRAGLRLLDGYAAAFPTRDDVREKRDMERARELKGGPLELVGGTFIPYDPDRPSDDLLTDNDDRIETRPSARIDSQGEEMVAK